MGKCQWFSVKIKVCQSSFSSPWSYPAIWKVPNWESWPFERYQTGSLGHLKGTKLGILAIWKVLNWESPLFERYQTGSLGHLKGTKLGVSAIWKVPNWESLPFERYQTGSLIVTYITYTNAIYSYHANFLLDLNRLFCLDQASKTSYWLPNWF